MKETDNRDFIEDASAIKQLYAENFLTEDQKRWMELMLVTLVIDSSFLKEVSLQDVLDYAREVTKSNVEYEYISMKVRKDSIPIGGKLVEAYETDKEIIVIGEPEEEPDDLDLWPEEKKNKWHAFAHSCDRMGCGGTHVLYRFSK